MNSLCFEPVSGASGDMILGALFDLGADPVAVTRVLQTAGLTDFEMSFSRKRDRHGLMAGFCEVRTPVAEHHEEHAHGSHHHRGLSDIVALIQAAAAPARAQQRALAIFQRLAEVEADVHGIEVEQVHFHEVGATDAIVDVFGACLALEQLDIEHVYCAEFKVGRGTVRCAHGVLPVPAPATVKLLEGRPVRRLDIESELTTPTGAAILTTLSEGDWTNLPVDLGPCGVGHGRRDFEQMPNTIRAFRAARRSGVRADTEWVEVLETDIDDDSPESLAALPEQLRGHGALDATLAPLAMKKGRTGVRLTVLARPEDTTRLADIVFSHSSTIGVRVSAARRLVLARSRVDVQTPWGPVAAKRIERPNGVEIAPEFESCREAAENAGVSIRQVMQAARRWEGARDECEGRVRGASARGECEGRGTSE